MIQRKSYNVVLFESVSHALGAEKIVKGAGIGCKLIHVPRHLSSDCGICLRFNADDRKRVEALLQGKLHFFEIQLL